MRQSARLLEQNRLIAGEFVRIELELAVTFCQVALGSQDVEKIRRNLQYARSAYDEAMRFAGKAHMKEQVFQQKVTLSQLHEFFAEVEASLRV